MYSKSILIFCFLATQVCFGQTFSLRSNEEVVVKLNGVEYTIDSTGRPLSTHFPNLDTLEFITDSPYLVRSILCNFKPDSIYNIAEGCCNELDIFSETSDSTIVRIRSSSTPSDSLFVWLANPTQEPQIKAIDSDTLTFVVTEGGEFANSIITLIVFRKCKSPLSRPLTDTESLLGLECIEVVAEINLRLFNQTEILLLFNPKLNQFLVERWYEF